MNSPLRRVIIPAIWHAPILSRGGNMLEATFGKLMSFAVLWIHSDRKYRRWYMRAKRQAAATCSSSSRLQ
jgi:hypothetical protein